MLMSRIQTCPIINFGLLCASSTPSGIGLQLGISDRIRRTSGGLLISPGSAGKIAVLLEKPGDHKSITAEMQKIET